MYGVTLKPAVGTPERLLMLLDWQEDIDPRLRSVLLELSEWTMRVFSKGLVITCLNRSIIENNKVGGKSTSAHLRGRAADIRSRSFKPGQLQLILRHLEKVWGHDFLYVSAHNSGHGPHIHINIRYAHNRGHYGRPQKGVT